MDHSPLIKHRIPISQGVAIFLLLVSRPAHRTLFSLGFFIALIGAAVRTWAAGHIHKDRKLSAEGPYALIRHPLYLGSALMALGFCLSVTNISFWGRTLLLWIFSGLGFYWMYQTKIQNEEIHLKDIFKEEYAHYRKNVPAMLPRKWAKWKIALDTSQFSWDKFHKNKEYKAWIGLFIIWVLLRFKLIYRI